MANTLVRLASATADGSTTYIVFSNIPQTYTDLLIRYSARTPRPSVAADNVAFWFNNDNASTNYSGTFMFAASTSAQTARQSNISTMRDIAVTAAAGNSANFFGPGDLYITNYTSSVFKPVAANSASENNSATNFYTFLGGGLWRSTAAVTTISLYGQNASPWVANSAFTLYGIKRN